MTDRELLELAALAAGAPWAGGRYVPGGIVYTAGGDTGVWNPLTDNGDALQLAVKLRLDVLFDSAVVEVIANLDDVEQQPWAWEKYETDPNSATRRAIVRAAAEIGKSQ